MNSLFQDTFSAMPLSRPHTTAAPQQAAMQTAAERSQAMRAPRHAMRGSTAPHEALSSGSSLADEAEVEEGAFYFCYF